MAARNPGLSGLLVSATTLTALACMFAACTSDKPASSRYRTEPVRRGTIQSSVGATGTVNPTTLVEVGTYVSGPVKAILADFNSTVTRGQLVAKIDPRPFELRVRQAQAELANARAMLEKSRVDLHFKELRLERSRKLVASGTLSEEDYDEAASAFEQARAQLLLDQAKVEQAQARLDEAKVNLAYTEIVSPLDGVVISRNVDVGQTVAASFQTPTLFLIAGNLRAMQVNAAVSEADIGLVATGQKATFTVDAFPDRIFAGKVSQVRNSPQNTQNVITYDVIIRVQNEDLLLRPGMTASVSIITAEREDVLKIPLAALHFRPARASDGKPSPLEGNGESVWLLDPQGRETPVAVAVGIDDGIYTEIRTGNVKQGDAVIVGRAPMIEADRKSAHPPGFGARYRRSSRK